MGTRPSIEGFYEQLAGGASLPGHKVRFVWVSFWFFLRVGEDGVQENLVRHLTMGLRNCVRAPVGWGQDCGRKGEKN